MNKKLIAVATTGLLLMASLTACGAKDDKAPASGSETTQSQTETATTDTKTEDTSKKDSSTTDDKDAQSEGTESSTQSK